MIPWVHSNQQPKRHLDRFSRFQAASQYYVHVRRCGLLLQHRSRTVCWSVTVVSPAKKTAEPIEMLFVLWARMDPRNCVLDGVQIAPCQMTIFRGKDMPGIARRHCAVSCAKIAELIEMPFGLWTCRVSLYFTMGRPSPTKLPIFMGNLEPI